MQQESLDTTKSKWVHKIWEEISCVIDYPLIEAGEASKLENIWPTWWLGMPCYPIKSREWCTARITPQAAMGRWELLYLWSGCKGQTDIIRCIVYSLISHQLECKWLSWQCAVPANQLMLCACVKSKGDNTLESKFKSMKLSWLPTTVKHSARQISIGSVTSHGVVLSSLLHQKNAAMYSMYRSRQRVV